MKFVKKVSYLVHLGDVPSVTRLISCSRREPGCLRVGAENFGPVRVATRGEVSQRNKRGRCPSDGRDRSQEKEDRAGTPQGAEPRSGAQTRSETKARAQGEGARVNDPDFYANATLGFRQWHLSLDATEETAFLEGLLKYGFHRPLYRWDPRGVNRAECLHTKFAPHSVPKGHGEVPGNGCTCGFYDHVRWNVTISDNTDK